MHWLPHQLPGDIPEGDIDQALNIDGKCLDAIQFPKAVPDPFAAERILSDQLASQAAFDDIGDNRPANGGNYPFDTNGGPGYATDTIYTAVFNAFSLGQWGVATALATVLLIVMLALGFVVLRVFRRSEVTYS